jgi:SnoaL-like domain
MARTQQALSVLPFAVAACLVLEGPAEATQCSDNMPPDWLTPPVTAPAPVDRLAIMDVISHYDWARDEKVSTGFEDLFTSNVVYEVCTDGGNTQLIQTTGPDNVASYLSGLTDFLKERNLRTRHLTSNTILNVVNQDTVEGKTTVLVLLQNAYSEIPELDYTATLKAEFKRGIDGAWRFGKLTVLLDTPVPPPGGARGR